MKVIDLKIDKQFNLSRDVTEATSAFMERLSSNILKANKKNKGQGEERLVPKFTLADGEVIVNSETHSTVADFLFTKGLCMTIDETNFVVAVNPPLVTELKMSEVVVAGLLIYPHKLEVEFADKEGTEVEWFASEKMSDEMLEKGAKQNKKAKVEAEDAIEWRKVGRGRLFTPGQELVQCRCVVSLLLQLQKNLEKFINAFCIKKRIWFHSIFSIHLQSNLWLKHTNSQKFCLLIFLSEKVAMPSNSSLRKRIRCSPEVTDNPPLQLSPAQLCLDQPDVVGVRLEVKMSVANNQHAVFVVATSVDLEHSYGQLGGALCQSFHKG